MNRLTIKGQVTVPKNVRDFLGLTAGQSAVEFSINEDGSVLIRKAAVRNQQAEHNKSYHTINHCDRVLALLNGYA